MRRSQRLLTFAVLISLCGVLAGCGSGGLNNWDPSDLLGFLDTKKKMQGNRQPVFPGGVPGIEQGVPKDLYKSDGELQQAQPATAPAPESGRARQQGAANGSSGGAEAAAADAGTAAAAPSKPKRLVHRRATSLPKEESPSAQQAAPPPPAAQQTEPAASPFPAPMPSGSFSR
ncbi:hypothetical protein GGQ85_002991 [Nitrobacter vulgaris]|jgi:hypothetical protein|uniref:Uncharacterized protein n=1 Tax=Nitrobacter vulgaris TaxID=29421 RepID=A0A1V4HXA7_NITVU|nr:hypothetical protein [Nitrobacter vulgaris]MDR6305271.1 hypothetical protein [Nitrobacter vulgaris]OPH82608.1 hypothetical protein B2M20_11080 [Nitrobacter vulgaris]